MIEETKITRMRDLYRAFQHNSALASSKEERNEYEIMADVLDWVLND